MSEEFNTTVLLERPVEQVEPSAPVAVQTVNKPTSVAEAVVHTPIEVKPKPVYDFVKRLFDIGVSLICLTVGLPIYLLIALAIVIDDPGNPFYVQMRTGKNGRKFKMYKFRSMYKDAEKRRAELLSQNEADGPIFKIANDPRVTKVGRFIRKTSIDELPQLAAVFTGQLSWVGPRPKREIFYDEFETYVHGFHERLKVKPGLTGLAQVNGGYDLRPEEKIIYDVEYIKKRSLWLDLKIMLKTVGVILMRGGAK